jgi:hypothetical protein
MQYIAPNERGIRWLSLMHMGYNPGTGKEDIAPRRVATNCVLAGSVGLFVTDVVSVSEKNGY